REAVAPSALDDRGEPVARDAHDRRDLADRGLHLEPPLEGLARPRAPDDEREVARREARVRHGLDHVERPLRLGRDLARAAERLEEPLRERAVARALAERSLELAALPVQQAR